MASGGLVQLFVHVQHHRQWRAMRCVPDTIIPYFMQKRFNSRSRERPRILRARALRDRELGFASEKTRITSLASTTRIVDVPSRASLDLRKLDSPRHRGPSLADRGVTSLRPRGCKRELPTRLKNRLGRLQSASYSRPFHRGTILCVGIAISF